MKRKQDTLITHSISSNTLNNATKFSYNSIQGHHHSIMGIERFNDENLLRWSMSVGCLLDPDSPAARYSRSAVLKRPILGLGMLLGERGHTLVISDMHLPYQHRDAFDFLEALDRKYRFARVLNVGDLYDHHRGSYHEAEPDAMSEDEEFEQAGKCGRLLQEMFPNMVITKGNHDNIPVRKLKTCGLSANIIGDYNKMYDTADTWEWVDRHYFDSWGSFPVVHPMVLNSRGRWDKCIMRV